MMREEGVQEPGLWREDKAGPPTSRALRLSTGTGSVSQWASEQLDGSSTRTMPCRSPMDPESHAAGTQSVCS